LHRDWIAQSSELPDGRGVRVGFLSRLALGNVEHIVTSRTAWHRCRSTTKARAWRKWGAGRSGLASRPAGARSTWSSCHLKSKLLTLPGGRFHARDEGERARFAGYAIYRRAAEAVTLRTYANELLDGNGRGRAVIMLGDLNDEAAAATTQILLGPPGSEIGTPGFDRPDQGDGSRLWNLAPLIPEERRFSSVFSGRGELIDHILVSRALVQRVGQVDTGPGEPASITEDPTSRRDEQASDHVPVVGRFRLD
jgi:hypothetical protein